MGTLKSYENKSGYYIVDYVPSQGFATLQTTGVAERLFDWVGLSLGDRIPQALVRAMLDVDLLWTGSSSEPPKTTDSYSLENLDTHAVRTGLSREQYRRLVGFCERYDGGRREALQELKHELSVTGVSLSKSDYPDPESLRERQNQSDSSGEIPSGFQDLHKIFIADKHLPDLVQESLRRWGADIGSVIEHPYGPVYAQAFTSYLGVVESFHSSENQITVEFQAPHPAGLFEEAYAPGPTAKMIFHKAKLPDLHYREVNSEADERKMYDFAWKAFQIQLQGSFPWEDSERQFPGGRRSEDPSIKDVTTAVRQSNESDSTSDILHTVTVQDYEIVDWETTFNESNQYKYDTKGRTRPNDLSSAQKLAVREQQLGAYRSIACLEEFLPGFAKIPATGVLNVPNPF